jgi:hypothetical protein
MSAGKIIAFVAAALFLFFGAMFMLAATSTQAEATGSGLAWFIIGLVFVLIAFGLIFFAARRRPQAETAEIVQKIDLSGQMNLEKLTCRNCGGALTADNIKMVAGAPVVSCPYCSTSYQLTEEPKW